MLDIESQGGPPTGESQDCLSVRTDGTVLL